MTGEELVKMWGEESDAANDCIIEILESYMEFCDLVIRWQPPYSRLSKMATQKVKAWTPILEHAKKAKEKGANNGETVIS